MSAGISRDEWLAALADVVAPPVDEQDAMTVVEFAALYRLSRAGAEVRLKKLLEQGRVRRTAKTLTLSDGRRRSYTAWALVKKGGSDARRSSRRRRDLRRSPTTR